MLCAWARVAWADLARVLLELVASAPPPPPSRVDRAGGVGGGVAGAATVRDDRAAEAWPPRCGARVGGQGLVRRGGGQEGAARAWRAVAAGGRRGRRVFGAALVAAQVSKAAL